MTTTQIIAPPGLKGVIVADTEIGEVRGDEGFYHYREFDAIELARTSTLEQVWQLLIDGELVGVGTPDHDRFVAAVAEARSRVELAGPLLDEVAAATTEHHAGLMATLPLVLDHSVASLDQTREQRRADVIALAASIPTLLASLHARRSGRAVTPPNADRSHAADWLHMAVGMEPSPEQVRLVETYLVATIDHGFNASTFTARVITSTGADVAAAFAGGIAALSGPLHGGAPGRALDMIHEIGAPSNTESWVTERLRSGREDHGFRPCRVSG